MDKPFFSSMLNKTAFLLLLNVLFSACQLDLKFLGNIQASDEIKVKRFDRLQYQYITTGDFSALQQMNTDYPTETRTLIEDVLKIGQVYEQQINQRMLSFYQDSMLQLIVRDAEEKFANMDQLNEELTTAFRSLRTMFPEAETPMVYSQIGSLDQSIIIKNGAIGISLDKYLGEDYELYKHFYRKDQLIQMNPSSIVPDCIMFYLISLYPLKDFRNASQQQRDNHFAKALYLTNQILKKKVYNTEHVREIEKYMAKHPNLKPEELMLQ